MCGHLLVARDCHACYGPCSDPDGSCGEASFGDTREVENVALGELMRRAALAPKDDEEVALRAALPMLRKSNAPAKAALDRALSNIGAREKFRPKR